MFEGITIMINFNGNEISSIGIVLADEQEYLPFVRHFSKYPAKEETIGGFKATVFDLGQVELVSVRSGIGKVNASCAAATLIHLCSCGILLNEGLSGGIKANISSFVVANRFVEHDFDLTPLGRELGRKPNEELYKPADETLLRLSKKIFGEALKEGTFGSGDSFVSDPVKAKLFEESFDELACDMESAAIASVCERNGVPFLSLRKISDGADGDSCESYNSMNDLQEMDIAEMIEKLIEGIMDKSNGI